MTTDAIRAAAASLLLARRPVISVNGNTAALVAREIVKLSEESNSALEVNLFHRTFQRERKIAGVLRRNGADLVMGVGRDASATINEVHSKRRKVDPRGILAADVVLVPLEDGDRTEALVKMGKKVIAMDLNPLSRTSRFASITIVDDVVNAVRLLTKEVQRSKGLEREELERIAETFHNHEYLESILQFMAERITSLRVSDL